MNKNKLLELIRSNLEKYLNYGFRFHFRFMNEFKELLLNTSGHESELFALLVKQLNFVKLMGTNVDKADSNEKLSHVQGDYYSLHLQAKVFNIRLLMTFDTNKNPVFLASFFERSGKRVTNYTKWIPVIEERFKEMEE